MFVPGKKAQFSTCSLPDLFVRSWLSPLTLLALYALERPTLVLVLVWKNNYTENTYSYYFYVHLCSLLSEKNRKDVLIMRPQISWQAQYLRSAL